MFTFPKTGVAVVGSWVTVFFLILDPVLNESQGMSSRFSSPVRLQAPPWETCADGLPGPSPSILSSALSRHSRLYHAKTY